MTKTQREIAAAAEKLAKCQETILLLGRQLKALCPPTELTGSPYNEMHQMVEGFMENEQSTLYPQDICSSQDFDQAEMHSDAASIVQRVGGESPSDVSNYPSSPSDTEVNQFMRSPTSSGHPKQRPKNLAFSSSSSTPVPEKLSRGFSRFFSSKAKNEH